MSHQPLTSFFSRDVFLQRQTHIRKRHSRKVPQLLTIPQLDIIVEEDEPKSCISVLPSPSVYSEAESRCASPSTESLSEIKTKRRDVGLTLADVRAAQEILSDVESDLDEEESLLPWLSCPYIPPTFSPGFSASPESIKFTFEDATLEFPQPPPTTPNSVASFEIDRRLSLSPAFSVSSSYTSSSTSSPSAESVDLPGTPPTSEEGEYGPPKPPPRNPLRLSIKSIKPLQIHKRNDSKPDLSITEDDFLLSSPLLDDQEWYTREISQFFSLGSPTRSTPTSGRPTTTMMTHKTRPDSVSFLPLPAMPPTPVSAGFPNNDLDPAFPRLRHSRSTSSLNGAPRPLPPLPTTPTSAMFSMDYPNLQRRGSVRGPLPTPPPVRPPPRSSLPSDYESFGFEDDQSIYQHSSSFRDSFVTRNTIRHARSSSFPESIRSFYSQASYLPPAYSPGISYMAPSVVGQDGHDALSEQETNSPQLSLDDVEFEFGSDARLRLPLSLPSSPIDLASDVLDAFEALRTRTVEV